MRPRLRGPALLLCAAVVAAPVQAGELLEFYRQARQRDATWQAAQHARAAALEAKPQARAALLPQLAASATQSIQHSETRIDGVAPRETDDEPWSLALNLTQSLFDWAALQRLREADAQVALAELALRSAAQDLVLRLADAYFNALAAADTLQSAQAEREAVQRQLDQAQARHEVGLSAVTEVQEAQARRDLTEATVIAAEQSLATARSALTEITAAPQEPRARLPEQQALPKPPADVDAWLQTAREHNLALLGAQLNTELADAGVSIARAGHLPTVALTASKSLSESANLTSADPGLGIGDERRVDSDRVGLTLNVPLFAGLATQSRVRQAASIEEQRRAELTGTERSVERQTRDAWLAVYSGAARAQALGQAVRSSRTALEAAQAGQEVGNRTFIDVLDAQRQLSAAERDWYRSRYDYLLARLRLQQAAGGLGEADILAIDRLLATR